MQHLSMTASAPKYPEVPAYGECMRFALNAVGIYAAPTLMSLIDAAFIGRVSTTALAALGPASSISDSVPFFVLFISIAATNLVAKSHADKDDAGSSQIARTSLGFGALTGAVLGVAAFLGAVPLARFYCGSTAVLTPLCAQYVAIRAIALPAVVVASVAQALCIGTKDTRSPMQALALAGMLNFAGDLLLVSRLGLGLAGAAWATVLSQYSAAAMLLRILHRRRLLALPAVPAGSSPTTTLATVRAILAFGSFVFVMAVKVGMHNACSAAAASLGGAPAAAHTALMAVAWLCFTFGDVGSSLAQAYLPAYVASSPQSKGVAGVAGVASAQRGGAPAFDLAAARPTINQLLKCTLSISATVVAISTVMLTVGSAQLTADPNVRKQMRRVLPLMAATLATHGTAVTLEGLLLARKAFRGLALTYTMVALTVGAALSFVRASGAGLLGVWAVYVWYCAVRVIAFAGVGGLLSWPGSPVVTEPEPDEVLCRRPQHPHSDGAQDVQRR